MKILVIDHNAVFRTYRQRYVELSKFADIDITILAPKYLDLQFKREIFQDKTEDEKYNILVIKPIGIFKSHRGFLNPFQLIKHIKKIRPDLIYIESEPESWYTAEIIFLKNIYCPECKVVLTTWMNINLYEIGYPFKFGFIYKYNYRYSLKNADGILCYTSEGIEQLKKNRFTGKLEKINWGVDLDKFKKNEENDLKKELNLKKITIGFSGRFVEEKGILNLVRAVSKLNNKNVSLLLIGSGSLKDTINDISNKLGINTIVIDNIDNSLMSRYYSCMDIFILPSITTKYWKEQFGRVLIEAMACEVPIIGSSSGEIPYVIGDAGLIFKEGDETDLAEKINLLMNNPELRKEKIIKGKERVNKYFSWDKITNRIYDFLIGVI